MIPIALFNPLSILISISTLTGVVLHDTQFDKLTVRLLAVPAVVATVEGSQVLTTNNLHTHVERASLSSTIRSLNASSPRIQPRNNDEKKHLLQKNVARGHHAFDNYNLPVIA